MPTDEEDNPAPREGLHEDVEAEARATSASIDAVIDGYIAEAMLEDLGVDFHDEDYIVEEGDEDLQESFDYARTRRESSHGIASQLPTGVEDNESEYEDEDDLHTESDSEDEGHEHFPEFNDETGLDSPELSVGMLFNDSREFKQACRNHGIKNRYQVWFPKNEIHRVKAECRQKICGWYAFASKVDMKDTANSTLQIKSCYLTHSYSKVHSNFHLTAKSIAERYLEQFRSDPDWKVQALFDAISREYGLSITLVKAYRAKAYAMEKINGDERTQYDHVYSYLAEMVRSNPGTSVHGRWKECAFVGMYICFGALKRAFMEGCRPLICLDGCWLKGLYGGQLLSAVGIDPNDCMFPIAYAMVETESKETWTWFLQWLDLDLGIQNSGWHWTFMSDRQKGIIGAVETLFPGAEHRLCVRHMYTNFRQKFKGKELKGLLWNAARASVFCNVGFMSFVYFVNVV